MEAERSLGGKAVEALEAVKALFNDLLLIHRNLFAVS